MISKKIEKGQPLGRRDTLRIQGTGCICAVPEYRVIPRDPTPLHFLNVKVISNSVRKEEDGSATQYSEFTDLVIAGNRATALASVLSKGQIVEFGGRMRSRSFDSRDHKDAAGKPVQIYRTECNVGQDGWIHIMKDAAEGKGEKALMPGAATPGTSELGQMAATLQTLMATLQAAAKTQGPADAPKEPVLDLTNEMTADGLTVDDDIPF